VDAASFVCCPDGVAAEKKGRHSVAIKLFAVYKEKQKGARKPHRATTPSRSCQARMNTPSDLVSACSGKGEGKKGKKEKRECRNDSDTNVTACSSPVLTSP